VLYQRRRVQRETRELDDTNRRLQRELDDPAGPGPARGTQDDPDDPPMGGPTPRF